MRYSAFSLAVRLFVLVLIVYEVVKRFFSLSNCFLVA